MTGPQETTFHTLFNGDLVLAKNRHEDKLTIRLCDDTRLIFRVEEWARLVLAAYEVLVEGENAQ